MRKILLVLGLFVILSISKVDHYSKEFLEDVLEEKDVVYMDEKFLYLNYIEEKKKPIKKLSRRKIENLPTSYNFYEEYPECRKPAHNQGGCGSCWLNTAAHVANDAICKHHVDKGLPFYDVLVSRQYYLACNKRGSCDGGSARDVYEEIVDNKNGKGYGLPSEECYPYKGYDEAPCYSKCENGEDMEKDRYYFSAFDHFYYPGVANEVTEEEKIAIIKQNILDYGPQASSFSVYSDFYPFRSKEKTDVYTNSDPTATKKGGHAIQLCGWGNLNGVDYWIAKNTWGNQWGYSLDSENKFGGFLNFQMGILGVDKWTVWLIINNDDDKQCTKTCSNRCGRFSTSCTSNGECIANNQCSCEEGYEGDDCDQWNCFGIDRKDNNTCSNRGICSGADICDCEFPYSGSECLTNNQNSVVYVFLIGGSIVLLLVILLIIFFVTITIIIVFKSKKKNNDFKNEFETETEFEMQKSPKKEPIIHSPSRNSPNIPPRSVQRKYQHNQKINGSRLNLTKGQYNVKKIPKNTFRNRRGRPQIPTRKNHI